MHFLFLLKTIFCLLSLYEWLWIPETLTLGHLFFKSVRFLTAKLLNFIQDCAKSEQNVVNKITKIVETPVFIVLLLYFGSFKKNLTSGFLFWNFICLCFTILNFAFCSSILIHSYSNKSVVSRRISNRNYKQIEFLILCFWKQNSRAGLYVCVRRFCFRIKSRIKFEACSHHFCALSGYCCCWVCFCADMMCRRNANIHTQACIRMHTYICDSCTILFWY